ncbi:coth protein-domain-containing protein [Parasitella parasitica]|nr:coth protein-domain-containing protein [Parasitella parasitica]
MVSIKALPLFLSLFALTSAQSQNASVINYSVINLLNETHSMGVSIDNVTYPLTRNENVTILHTGRAPIATSGYRYVKITKENNNTEIEPFLRSSSQNDTANEFFKRSWNSKELTQLPAMFEPLPAIKRISSQLHRDGEIPTIHLTGNQTLLDNMHNSSGTEDIDVPTNMTYVTLNETLSYEGVTLSLAGRSSRWMPKLSYNVKLSKNDRLYSYRRVKLRALNTDPSYIRESMAYDIIKSSGLASSEFSYVRVLLNNRELGLFGLIDTFHNPWLANVFDNGNSKYKNGNLYQAVFATANSSAANHTSDLSYYDNITAYQDGQYEVKVKAAKEKKDDFKPLMDFTKFISTAPTNSSGAVAAWKKELDTDSFLRTMALEVLLGFSDGYNSMADNYYLYENPKAGNFFYIPSDMDLTMGSTIFKLADMWSGNYSTFPGMGNRPLMRQILEVPEFKQQFEQLLVNMSQSLTNPTVVNNRIDDIVDMITEDVAWDQSLPRVGANLISQMGSAINSNSSFTNASVDSAAANVVGDAIPDNFDLATIKDFAGRMNLSIPFSVAVNGDTGHASLSGVKEWFQKSSENILTFFGARNSSDASNATTTA